MPNYCNNYMTVSHTDLKRLEPLADAAREGNLFNTVDPVPAELLDERLHTWASGPEGEEFDQLRNEMFSKHGYSSAYNYCVNRWGTKWEMLSVDTGEPIEITQDGMFYSFSVSFDTAWAPPIGIAQTLVDQGFAVTLDYYEPGAGFVGRFEDGADDYADFVGATAENVREIVGDEYDDFWGISESMAQWEE